jgi:hypothetical protein
MSDFDESTAAVSRPLFSGEFKELDYRRLLPTTPRYVPRTDTQGAAWCGSARHGRQGKARPGRARHGRAGQINHGRQFNQRSPK